MGLKSFIISESVERLINDKNDTYIQKLFGLYRAHKFMNDVEPIHNLFNVELFERTKENLTKREIALLSYENYRFNFENIINKDSIEILTRSYNAEKDKKVKKLLMKQASGYAPRKRSPMKAAKSVRAVPLSQKAAFTNNTFSP